MQYINTDTYEKTVVKVMGYVDYAFIVCKVCGSSPFGSGYLCFLPPYNVQ
jgi:hypothetical protein